MHHHHNEISERAAHAALRTLLTAATVLLCVVTVIALSTALGGCVQKPVLIAGGYSIQCDGKHLVDEATGEARCEARAHLLFNVGYVTAEFGQLIEYEVEGETVWCPTVLLEGSGELQVLGEQGGKVEGLPPDFLELLDPRCEEVMPPLRFTPLEKEGGEPPLAPAGSKTSSKLSKSLGTSSG